MLRLVVAASLLFLAAGCTDPEPREPKEPTPTASPRPTIAAPTMPAQAKENSPEGASAFARFFISVLNFSIQSGKPEVLDKLISDGCRGCADYVNQITEDRSAGRQVEGFDWKVRDIELADQVVRVLIDARQYRMREPGEAVWSIVRAAKHALSLKLSYKLNTWTVEQMSASEVRA